MSVLYISSQLQVRPLMNECMMYFKIIFSFLTNYLPTETILVYTLYCDKNSEIHKEYNDYINNWGDVLFQTRILLIF